jgi:ribosomal protein S19
MKSKTIIPILILLIIITISIIYNTLPRLQLNGPQNMVISYRDEYEEQGVIVKNATGNYMSKIKIDSNIDTKKIGNYYVDYSLKIGGKTLHVRRNVKVIDDINPVIKLKGEQIIKMSINKQYIEPGYIAIDEYDGDITNKVQITGEIDAENYGEYVLTYKATDNSNNQTEVNRIIKVVDEIKPKMIIAERIVKTSWTADGFILLTLTI